MELIVKNDSNVKMSIYKDETIVSTVVGKGSESSSIVQQADGITAMVGK